MTGLNKAWFGVLATLAALAAGGAAVVYSGWLDVAADTPHGPLVYRLLAEARERSIARRSGAIQVPADLDDSGRQRRGAGNYAAMCAGCHLAPGVMDSEIRRGLYPTPPDLARPAEGIDTGVARRFWIIKHGIKATAMPAWSKGGMEDAAIWDLVAFLDRLPDLGPEQYRDLVAASPGHAHAGLEPEASGQDGRGHDHGHGGHDH